MARFLLSFIGKQRGRKMKTVLAAGIAVAIAGGSVADAATLLTSSAGFAGQTLNLYGHTGPYEFTGGPVTLAGGIIYTSTAEGSVIGTGGYGLSDNGYAVATPIVGTNSETDTVTFTFATPVSAFGGRFNYAVSNGAAFGLNPVIAAYDASNTLIASYDLLSLATISTPDAIDAFAFRGIDGGGTGIASFTLTGTYLVIAGGVPEPMSWVLMLGGFAAVGTAARRRERSAAA